MDVDEDPAAMGASPPNGASGFAAAYNLGGTKGKGGPQCSSHPDDFCFFCSYESDPNAERGSQADLYGSLVSLVQTMTHGNKEFPSVVESVWQAYNCEIRPHVCDETFGDSPVWTRESIARHLTYSAQFRGVFRAGVTQMLHSLVSAHNEHMIDAATGQVIESERAALMSTLAMMMKWEKFSGHAPSSHASSRSSGSTSSLSR